jgi:hypothetical protein
MVEAPIIEITAFEKWRPEWTTTDRGDAVIERSRSNHIAGLVERAVKPNWAVRNCLSEQVAGIALVNQIGNLCVRLRWFGRDVKKCGDGMDCLAGSERKAYDQSRLSTEEDRYTFGQITKYQKERCTLSRAMVCGGRHE